MTNDVLLLVAASVLAGVGLRLLLPREPVGEGSADESSNMALKQRWLGMTVLASAAGLPSSLRSE